MALILTEKHLDILSMAVNPNVEVLVLEGTIRSSKTVIAIQAFYMAVKISPEPLHLISAKDYDAIRDNILDCNGLGLLHLFDDVELVKPKIGSYYLRMMGADGKRKIIIMAGYSNVRMWEKILGKTLGVELIDEVNIADKAFLDESRARQASVDRPFAIWTLNGDNPEHAVYTDYINYAKPIGKVPKSILTDMLKLKNKKGWYYTHWTFSDNPVMTPAKIERAMELYPVGSYFYTIKILGERGVPEGSIFAQYLNDSFFAAYSERVFKGSKVMMDDVEYNLAANLHASYVIGIDLGNNELKKGTVLTFTGYTRGYQYVDIIDAYPCEKTESQALVDEICDKIREWTDEVVAIGKVLSIRIDGFGAVKVLVPTIRKKLNSMGIFILTDTAIKFGEDGGRMERLSLIMIMVSRRRLRFSNRIGARTMMSMLRKLRYGEDGLPLDTNQEEMDYYDSMGYSITPMMKELTNIMR